MDHAATRTRRLWSPSRSQPRRSRRTRDGRASRETEDLRLETFPLSPHKGEEFDGLLHSHRLAKDHFPVEPAPAKTWGPRDSKRGFRDATKAAGACPAGKNVHLVDRAALDAADTWVGQVEAVLATGELKAKASRCYRIDEPERRYAYTCLKRYGWIGEILRDKVAEIDSKTLAGPAELERARSAGHLHRVLRKAL